MKKNHTLKNPLKSMFIYKYIFWAMFYPSSAYSDWVR